MKYNKSIVLKRNMFHEFEVLKSVNYKPQKDIFTTAEVEKLLADRELKVIIEYEEVKKCQKH